MLLFPFFLYFQIGKSHLNETYEDNMTPEQNSFMQFSLSMELVETLTMLGYTTPTDIQKAVIPEALAGRDIVGRSQTGTGKTAAFAIPVCEKICWLENLPQALILEPTRELAQQIKTEVFHIGRKKRLKVPALFGGMPIDKQILTLKQKSHIIVGTPGRIMDHVRRKSLALSNVRYLIIDEADLMLNMGFLDEVSAIMEYLPNDRQTMLFSATLNEEINNLINQYMKEPTFIMMTTNVQTAPQISQELLEVAHENKYKALLSLLIQENPADCMIFCATREMVNTLYQKLRRDNISCGMLHGEIEQRERLRTIEGFRDGRFHYLICTDVAARGIDFDQITHVIQYDFPTGKETYVHRIGRTGRNGQSGKAISLITPEERHYATTVEAYIGTSITTKKYVLSSDVDDELFWKRQNEKQVLKKRKGAVFQKSITKLTISGGRKSKMRAIDIVGTICSIDGILADDIGIIDIRDSLTYVEILNEKGTLVLDALQAKTIKGKLRKVSVTSAKQFL